MPARVLLQPPHVALLLDLAGFAATAASPLATLAAAAPCSLDGPGGDQLVERGLLIDETGTRRLNTAFRAVLETAARPDEVLRLQVTGPRQPGFALCRRGDFWTECTVGPLGVTKLEYPLTRTAMVVAAGAALSTPHDDPPPLGFHFRGPAADLTVLHAIIQAHRSGIPTAEVPATVRSFLEQSPGSMLAATLADPTGLRALIEEPTASTEAVDRLIAQGLLVTDADQITGSRAALAALRRPATAGFVASRTVATDNQPRASAIQVWRTGDRNLVVRPVRLESGAAGIDVRDIGRPDLRALVAAVFQDEALLAEVVRASAG